jgi:hypothetical protein
LFTSFPVSLFTLLSLFTCLAFTPAPADSLAVELVNYQRQPLAGETITLTLYRVGPNALEEWPAGECLTDAAGKCRIDIGWLAPKDASGFLRGRVTVGEYGQRSLIWPGGALEVKLWLNAQGQLDVPGEGPLDTDDAAGALPFVPPQTLPRILGWLAALLLGGLLIWFLYRKAKSQK